jgi:hypothetical protein
MPWDVFASQLSRYLRITYVATALSGIAIVAELTVVALRGNPSDKRRAIVEAVAALREANPTTLQLLLLTVLTLLVAYLIGLAAQFLIFWIRPPSARLLFLIKDIFGKATLDDQYGEEAVRELDNRYGRETVKALIAKHPIAVSLDEPETLFKASEYSAFWLQRNVPEFPQSSLTNFPFILYSTVVPILLAPFVIEAMQYRVGVMSYEVVSIPIAIIVSGWILSRANRMIDRVPTLLVRLFVAYALVADHSPAQPPPANSQNADQGPRRGEAATR